MSATDDPLSQAVRFLVEQAGKMAAERGWGEVRIGFQDGRITAIGIDRTYKPPNVPCLPRRTT